MNTSPASGTQPRRSSSGEHSRTSTPAAPTDLQLSRWGGGAGVAGAAMLVAATVVVVGAGLPDASDVETLTDFADIETGRIAEHFFYLGALIMFALHTAVLHRVLKTAHSAAALFGTVVAQFGLGIMAASSMLHVSTSPLSDLYTDPDASPGDLQAIEYAWHSAQSVFDTMLATGVLLVPIGIALLAFAMRTSPRYGPRFAWVAMTLGTLGALGAAIEIVDPELEFSAAGVLAMVVFHLVAGWKTFRSEGE